MSDQRVSEGSPEVPARRRSAADRAEELLDQLLELPVEVQLSVLRAIAPPLLASLEPHERRRLLRDIDNDVHHLTHAPLDRDTDTLH
ncbi:MAG: hypothetical protein ACK4N5_22395 [Myxococcales bacterium]